MAIAVQGDILYASGADRWARLAAGTAGQVLATQGAAANPKWVGGETTITTTGNIDDLDFGVASVIRMNNASLATIRGLVAGTAGQVVTIVSTNAQVNFAHQNAGSTAANRLINAATSGATPILGGIARYIYDATTQRWRLLSHLPGSFIDVAFDAANFTASSGTWTVASGDQIAFKYQLAGKILTITFAIQTTDVSATPANLLLLIPGGFTAALEGRVTIPSRNAGTYGVALMRVVATGSQILLYSDVSAAGWATAAGNTDLWGFFSFEVE